MATSVVGWQVLVGDQVTASIADPPGGLYGHILGARIEVPVTRAIVSTYERAVLSGGVWTVTLAGLLEAGAYEFVWRTDDAEPPYYEVWIPIAAVGSIAGGDGGTTYPGGGTDFPEIDRSSITPSPDDVAPLERSRIVSPGGGDPGTFTADTHPTQAEVALLIEHAVDDTLNQLPYGVDPRHYEAIRNAVTLYAATLVETSYFREQLDEGSVRLYREMFESTINAINARVADDYRAVEMADGTVGPILS